MKKFSDDSWEDVNGRTEAKHLAEQLMDDHPVISNLIGVGVLAVGAVLVGRVVKKQSLAAKIRSEHPNMSYHESIGAAMDALKYRDHPFRV